MTSQRDRKEAMTEQMVTAGPWELCERGDYDDFDGNSRVIVGDDRRIAVIQTDGSDEDEANAHFIFGSVRACFAVSHSHPELVAEGIEEAFRIINACAASSLDSGQDNQNMFARSRALLSKLGLTERKKP